MKVTITGYMSMSGTSYKKNKDGVKYDINQIQVRQELTSAETDKYKRVAGGFETSELQVSNELIEKIKNEKVFPFDATVTTEQFLLNGRINTLIKDYQKV